MERSDSYNRRKEMMETLEVPTISEVKEELGEPLAMVFFQELPGALQVDMGLTPSLTGAGDDLWISPSDLLRGKVCLKPPLTSKHMKALTHEGILLIGRDIEIKFENEKELEKLKALAEQEELLNFMHERDKKLAVEAAIREQQELCACEMERLSAEFEEKLREELEALEERLRSELEKLHKEEMAELEQMWQEKLELAVEETVNSLTEKFLEDLKIQEELLHEECHQKLKKQELKCHQALRTERDRAQEMLRQLKHQLECKNVANLMYTLCMERRKCASEREEMENEYQNQVAEFQDLCSDKQIEISKLTEERNEKQAQLNLREQCVLEILRQFQKFINFALRSTPTQAEFLLNVEKMMLFELTQKVVAIDVKHKKRLAKKIMPWKSDSRTTSTTTTSSNKSLIIVDHHKCFNELTPPVSEHSLKSGDDLPALHYNQYMYVREDFRNMISQGLKISSTNMLWNKDVENLMEILRHSNSAAKLSESEIPEPTYTRSEPSRRSSVHFHINVNQEEDDANVATCSHIPSESIYDSSPLDFSYGKKKKISSDIVKKRSESSMGTLVSGVSMSRRSSMKPKTYVPAINVDYMKDEETKNLLLAARNSLEIHRESFCESQLGEDIQHIAESVPLRYNETLDEDEMNPYVLIVRADELKLDKISLKQAEFEMYDKTSSLVSSATQSEKCINVINKCGKSLDSIKESKVTLVIDEESLNKHSKQNLPKLLVESKLSLARDSVILRKQSIVHRLTDSKLSFAKDSIEVKRLAMLAIAKMGMGKTSKETLKELQEKLGEGKGEFSEYRGSKEELKDPKEKLSSSRKTSRDSMNVDEFHGTPKVARSKMELTKHSEEKHKTQDQSIQVTPSKLSMHRDSFDIISAKLSSKEINHVIGHSKESIEILDGILGKNKASPPVTKMEDDGSKVVKISHIEVLGNEEGEKRRSSIVSFSQEPDIIDTVSLHSMDSPWLIYKGKKQPKATVRENFLKKPNVAAVTGDRQATEYMKKSDEFTVDRVKSMLQMLKNHPDLIRMFTPCTN